MDNKPLCKYGATCYRKNPDHLRRFLHPGTKREVPASGSISEDTKRRKLDEDENDPLPSQQEESPEDALRCVSSVVYHRDMLFCILSIGKGEATSSSKGEATSSLGNGKGKATNSLGNDAATSAAVTYKDSKDAVRNQFLVDFPEDFYAFWDFCESLQPQSPSSS